MAAPAIEVAPEFGYVLLVIVASYIINMYLGFQVGGARKKYGVQYPTMYSEKSQVFNCYQRAHQNFLEVYPPFLALQLLAGLQYPAVAAGFGALFLVARIVYAHGYYSGDPKKRIPGGILAMVATVALLGMTVKMAGRLVGWWN